MVVVIPTCDRPKVLKKTLKSLSNCEIPEIYSGTLIIENGSREGVKKIVSNMKNDMNARYKHHPWGNKSNAINIAICAVRNELVVFFDDDLKIAPDTLVAYAEAAKAHERRVFFGGTVEVEREIEPPSWLKDEHLPISACGYDVEDSSGDWYPGCNWAAYSEDIRALGGFDVCLGPGSTTGGTGQETDMQVRMCKSGFQPVDVPNATVTHRVRRECFTLGWILHRRYKSGIEYGYKNRVNMKMFFSISQMVFFGLGMIFKGTLVIDISKVISGMCAISRSIGIVKYIIVK